jgi:hypothetical protein
LTQALLGLSLERALEELARDGVMPVCVERSLAPRRGGETGEWRVVRVRAGEAGAVTLDVCCFQHAADCEL